MPPISDHPLRYQLANELHARPFPTLPATGRAVFIAIKQPDEAPSRDRQADLDHLIALLDRHGADHPKPGATHWFGQIGKHRMKWESHTEFVTYTAFLDGPGERPFDPDDFAVFPSDWLEAAPGQRITSVMVRVENRPETEAEITARLADWFVSESVAISHVVDDAAVVAGDFRIDPAGHLRFAVFPSEDTGRRRVGRIVQRLLEIETYKTMSMLGFQRVQSLGPRMHEIDTELGRLMSGLTEEGGSAEDTLKALLTVSAELESLSAQSAFRFGATAAYEAIVTQRIEVLREERFAGRQTFAEFMMRRFDPAIRTVKHTERRLQTMADRAMRAGDLLRTRVDVARSAQNQALLESMDRRADLQLRLQKTVEGFSVVAISYYAVSLGGYLLYPLADAIGVSKGTVTAAITLPVVAVVFVAVRRMRGKIG
ncbi:MULTISPECIES: DUF3422 family protein [unclassified Rhodosalinus]|uniref:DUF3422 family protein n=1 Tax=unclassified Rhodosalinus TaxID=2630183 RepID=UPI0035242295